MTFLHRYAFGLVGLAIAIAAISEPTAVRADSAHPLRLVMRCDAGSPIDLVARIVAEGLANNSGRLVFVVNVDRGADDADLVVNDPNAVLFQISDCGDKSESSKTSIAGE